MENKTVIKVVTSYFSTKRGVHFKKDFLYQKRRSVGYNILEEDSSATTPTDTLLNIINLLNVDDGLYEVIIVNVTTDYESGIVDGYEYKLIPYTEEKLKDI